MIERLIIDYIGVTFSGGKIPATKLLHCTEGEVEAILMAEGYRSVEIIKIKRAR